MLFFDETTSLQAVQKIALPLTHCSSFGSRFIRSRKEFLRLKLHLVWSITGIRKIRTGRRLAVLFLSKVRKLCSFFQIMLKVMLAQSTKVPPPPPPPCALMFEVIRKVYVYSIYDFQTKRIIF